MKLDLTKFVKILVGALAGALEDGKLTADDIPEALITILKESIKEETK